MKEKDMIGYENLDNVVGGSDVHRGPYKIDTKGTIYEKISEDRILVETSGGKMVFAPLADNLKPQYNRIRIGDSATINLRPNGSDPIITAVVFSRK